MNGDSSFLLRFRRVFLSFSCSVAILDCALGWINKQDAISIHISIIRRRADEGQMMAVNL